MAALGWRAGRSAGGMATSSRCRSSVPAPPALALQTPWERVTAEYDSSGMSLNEHPLELLRPTLDERTVTCAALEPHSRTAARWSLAGLPVARQRPATARGVMFLLIEDESGVANVIVLPPVYDRQRLARPYRFARLDRRPPRAPRGRDQRRCLLGWPDRATRRAAGTGPQHRAAGGARAGRAGRRPRRSVARRALVRAARPLRKPCKPSRPARPVQDALHERLYVRHHPYLRHRWQRELRRAAR